MSKRLIATVFVTTAFPLVATLAGQSQRVVLSRPSPARESRVEQLVADLGHGWYQRRERAARELRKIGPDAVLPLLRAASDDHGKASRPARRLLIELATEDYGVGDRLIWIAKSQVAYSQAARAILNVPKVVQYRNQMQPDWIHRIRREESQHNKWYEKWFKSKRRREIERSLGVDR